GRASHPRWNQSLAPPTHSSDSDLLREEATRIAAPRVAADASVDVTHGTSLIPLRTILRQLGNGSRLGQAGTRLGPALPRPRLPAPRAVADPVVGHDPEHRVDQRRAGLRPPRFHLPAERRQP